MTGAALDPALDPALARALDYPYPAHPQPFLFRRGGIAEPLPAGFELSGLTPVVAVGSNRAPEQLARKYAAMDVAIPVTRLTAIGVDVVFAAHMAGYGAIPATLAPAPGVTVELWITWLDGPALARMDETEAVGVNYDRRSISPDVASADPTAPADALIYTALRGCLAFDGAAVPLATIPATGRTAPALTERQVLERLHHDAGTAETFADWLAGHIGEAGRDRRNRLIRRLAAAAIKVDLDGISALEM